MLRVWYTRVAQKLITKAQTSVHTYTHTYKNTIQTTKKQYYLFFLRLVLYKDTIFYVLMFYVDVCVKLSTSCFVIVGNISIIASIN